MYINSHTLHKKKSLFAYTFYDHINFYLCRFRIFPLFIYVIYF
ncbi:hypothetical protein HMPREF3033_00910 [Veillonellaceae bacterium DNF00751]|nr:hypothetical protein HMPREF3033_00910 [Veillonellaceae bacterium DNF00751]